METQSISKVENLGLMLDSAREELDRFRAELGNDKTSIKLKFEEFTEDLKDSIHEMRTMIQDDKSANRAMAAALEEKLDMLEQHLNRQAANDMHGSLASIKEALRQVVNQLMESTSSFDLFPVLCDRVHRFMIKTEILRLKFELGKIAIKDFAGMQKVQFSNKIQHWEVFRKEIAKAYGHLHQAFTVR